MMTVQPQDESLSLEISDIFKELERKETRRSSAPGLLSLPGTEPGRPSDRDLRLVPFGRLTRAKTAAAGGNADQGDGSGPTPLPSPRTKPAQLRAWGGPRWSAAVLRPAGPPCAKRAQPALGGACQLESRGVRGTQGTRPTYLLERRSDRPPPPLRQNNNQGPERRRRCACASREASAGKRSLPPPGAAADWPLRDYTPQEGARPRAGGPAHQQRAGPGRCPGDAEGSSPQKPPSG